MQPFTLCLNTATLRPYRLPIVELAALTAAAGFAAIEPWLDEIDSYLEAGGDLAALKRTLDDLGLAVANLIAFPTWISNDPAARAHGLGVARRATEVACQLGARTIAAPPIGEPEYGSLALETMVERYRALCDACVAGVTPLLEIWGASMVLRRLGAALFVAAECGRPNVGVLLDVYHLHKGGSDFAGLELISGAAMPVFHINDYPGEPAPAALRVRDRRLPGAGVAPLMAIVQSLRAAGFHGFLSLELFPEERGADSPALALDAGFRALHTLVARADRVRM